MKVRELGPDDDDRWESFVARHPEGSAYQHPAWVRVVASRSAPRPLTLACEDQHGNLCGILPLCHTRGTPFGVGGPRAARRLSSLPRTPVGGPLAVTPEAAGMLVSAAFDHVRSCRPSYQLELKPPAPVAPLEGVEPVSWSTSYVVELPSHPDQLRFGNSRTHASVRRAVAKAERGGVRIRSGNDESDLRMWYPLYLEAMRSHLVVPRPYSFFVCMWRTLKPLGMMRLLLAESRQDGSKRTLAGSIFLSFGPTVIFGYNGRSSDYLDLRPNDAIQWQAIHDACRDGFRRFDLGEVEDHQPGLERFKRKWGATPQRLARYYFPPFRETTAPAESASRMQTVRRALWRRLPLPVTATLGAAAYRYL